MCFSKSPFRLVLLMFLMMSVGCAKSTTSGVSLKINPVAGPSAASLYSPMKIFSKFMGMTDAFASVSSFTSFKICNDTLVIKDVSGNTVLINGKEAETGVGLITVSPTTTTATTLTTFDLPKDTQIKEVYITSAVAPSVCSGANYAVEFDPTSAPISITQNTQFKFTFATPMVVTGEAQDLTVLFGAIIDSMVALGTGLNDSSIQTIAVNGTAE